MFISGDVKLENDSCNLCCNKIARQVVRKSVPNGFIDLMVMISGFTSSTNRCGLMVRNNSKGLWSVIVVDIQFGKIRFGFSCQLE